MGLSESGVRLVADGAQAFENQIERASRAVNDFGDRAAQGSRGLDMMNVAAYALGEAIGTFIVRGFDAAKNAITGFISTGWEFGAVIDSATVSLTNFLGSQEAANEALEMAQRRAARTPFAFQDYARSLGSIAAIQRANGGELEDYLDLVERLASANPAEGFQGATFALRQAFSGDFLSLQDRFDIPKDTIAAMKEAGFSIETLDAALAGLGFTSELVAAQGETLEGRWSTLKGTFDEAAGTFMGPIRDAIANGIFGLQGALDENMPIIEARLVSAGQFVADAITSFRQGWEGNWVDDDIIQPLHRVAGNLGINVREAIDNARLAWEKWNEMVQKGKDLWNSPWLQEKIVQPLFDLGTLIAENLIKDFQKLNGEWRDLNEAGEAWNGLMLAGQELWETYVRYAGLFGVNLEGVNVNLGNVNTEMGEGDSLGKNLARVFKALTAIVGYFNEKLEDAVVWLKAVFSWAIEAAARVDAALDAFGVARENNFNEPNAFTPNAGSTSNSGGSIGGTSSAPPSTSPPGGQGGKGPVSVNVVVNVPPNTSPRVAAGYVTDGVTQSMRSKGLA